MLKEVARTQLNPKKTKAWTADELPWHIDLKPSILALSQVKPEAMNLKQLYRTIQYRRANQLMVNPMRLVWWQRLAQPLTIVVMLLLAIPSVLGSLRTGSMGFRLFIGICLGFVFFIFKSICITYWFSLSNCHLY